MHDSSCATTPGIERVFVCESAEGDCRRTDCVHAYSEKYLAEAERLLADNDQRGFYKLLMGTLARSGIRRQVHARRCLGNMCIRHGIRVRDLQPRSVFPGC